MEEIDSEVTEGVCDACGGRSVTEAVPVVEFVSFDVYADECETKNRNRHNPFDSMKRQFIMDRGPADLWKRSSFPGFFYISDRPSAYQGMRISQTASTNNSRLYGPWPAVHTDNYLSGLSLTHEPTEHTGVDPSNISLCWEGAGRKPTKAEITDARARLLAILSEPGPPHLSAYPPGAKLLVKNSGLTLAELNGS